uniref:Uncharacterized protein LOC113794748 n=1 Tax=Dermatophagoides pteronyssinus TaxID=6956 RepID=A0A6P6Y824_DERPT|nr:uncharacterized protein LOC113794748 [Dermatophagoides pteronyssinus]
MFRSILLSLLFLICLFQTLELTGAQSETPISSNSNTMETTTISDRIVKSMAKLNINVQTKLQDLVADLDKLEEIETAYEPSYMQQNIDIFKLGVVETAQKFFTAMMADPIERQQLNLDGDLDKRMKTFVDNLKELAKIIQNELKKPKENRARYGLTPFAALDEKESRMMTHGLMLHN